MVHSLHSRLHEQNTRLYTELEDLRQKYNLLIAEISSAGASPKKEATADGESIHALRRTEELNESLYLEKVKRLIKEQIQRYDADKTGLADYALESSGDRMRFTVFNYHKVRTYTLKRLEFHALSIKYECENIFNEAI